MQVLTLKGVKRAALHFYKRGRLTAQRKTPTLRVCVYQQAGGYRCAIGAALSAETLDAIHTKHYNAGYGIEWLTKNKVLKVRPGVLEHLKRIQLSHDSWAQFKDPIRRETARKEFLALIS